MENLLKNLEELRERFLKIKGSLDVDALKQEKQYKERLMNEPGFWDDQEKAVEISKRVEELRNEINKWEEVENEITELEELVAMAEKEEDDSFEEEANKRYEQLEKKFKHLEFHTLFSGSYDRNNAIISIHVGAGGVDAQDWAQMLERMYLRFIEKKGWKATILDRSEGNEAGIKSVTIKVKGEWSYGYLRSEAGVHRLVRISPFDAEGSRHTSFAMVETIPEISTDEEKIELKEEDIKMDTYGASGPGGWRNIWPVRAWGGFCSTFPEMARARVPSRKPPSPARWTTWGVQRTGAGKPEPCAWLAWAAASAVPPCSAGQQRTTGSRPYLPGPHRSIP